MIARLLAAYRRRALTRHLEHLAEEKAIQRARIVDATALLHRAEAAEAVAKYKLWSL
ncbi:MAG: hypothetical protein V4857_14165 [Pseudomonadota bacterium]